MAIDFNTIEYAFLFVSGDAPFTHQAFINRETGKSYFVSEYSDFSEYSDDLPEDIETNDIYLEIPHKNDLDLGFGLVKLFAKTYMPEHIDEIYNLFRRKGAYRRFKNWIESKGRIHDWHQFEEQQTGLALRNWCLENNIELNDLKPLLN